MAKVTKFIVFCETLLKVLKALHGLTLNILIIYSICQCSGAIFIIIKDPLLVQVPSVSSNMTLRPFLSLSRQVRTIFSKSTWETKTTCSRSTLHLVHADIPCSFLLLLFDPCFITVCVQWSATASRKTVFSWTVCLWIYGLTSSKVIIQCRDGE